ncbi:transposable element Tcb2 transposase [Trichonephila clavipes]|nr:transposable element Tcb2 transposase [Trichonephila clavipes]
MMEAGWSAWQVASQLGRTDCVVMNFWDQWIREMSFTRMPGSGCPRQTSRRKDRHIAINARVQPNASSATIQAHSDESRFSLSSDYNRVRVWRLRAERINLAFALHRHTTPTAGMMVWGAIAYNPWSPLVFIRGTMTTQRYVHDIPQPHV